MIPITLLFRVVAVAVVVVMMIPCRCGCVVGGVLGHLVRLVQHDEDMKPTVEQQLAPFSRDYPSGQHVVFTLDIPAENGGTDISSYAPSDEEDWLPLE